MALVVNTNVASIAAQRNLNKTSNMLNKSITRLSTGLRINGAADDSAGLAISTRFSSQIRGLDQAARNSNDGISLLQTAEAAMDEQTNILQRMRELAVQAANSTNSASDRSSIQSEIDALYSELDRIADTTKFNGIDILKGLDDVTFQVGANSGDTLSFSIDAVTTRGLNLNAQSGLGELNGGRATTIGSLGLDGTNQAGALIKIAATRGTVNVNAGDIIINGINMSAMELSLGSIGQMDFAVQAASYINKATGRTGVSATAYNTLSGLAGASGVTTGVTGTGLTINGSLIAASGSMEELVTNINRDASGVTALLNSDGAITLSNDTGKNIVVANATNTGLTAGTFKGFLSLSNADDEAISIEVSKAISETVATTTTGTAIADNTTIDGLTINGAAIGASRFTTTTVTGDDDAEDNATVTDLIINDVAIDDTSLTTTTLTGAVIATDNLPVTGLTINDITIDDSAATSTVVNGVVTNDTAEISGVVINGTAIDAIAAAAGGGNIAAFIDAINAKTINTGVVATLNAAGTGVDLTDATGASIDVEDDGVGEFSNSGLTDGITTANRGGRADFVAKINARTADTGVTAQLTTVGGVVDPVAANNTRVTLTAADGRAIDVATTVANAGLTAGRTNANGGARADLIAKINAKTAETGVTAALGTGGDADKVILTAADGRDIEVDGAVLNSGLTADTYEATTGGRVGVIEAINKQSGKTGVTATLTKADGTVDADATLNTRVTLTAADGRAITVGGTVASSGLTALGNSVAAEGAAKNYSVDSRKRLLQFMGLTESTGASNVSGSAVTNTKISAGDNIKINGVALSSTNSSDAAAKAAAINAISSQTGVTATASSSLTFSNLDFSQRVLNSSDVTVNGVQIDLRSANSVDTVVSKITNAAGLQGVTAQADGEGNLILTSDTGVNISVGLARGSRPMFGSDLKDADTTNASKGNASIEIKSALVDDFMKVSNASKAVNARMKIVTLTAAGVESLVMGIYNTISQACFAKNVSKHLQAAFERANAGTDVSMRMDGGRITVQVNSVGDTQRALGGFKIMIETNDVTTNADIRSAFRGLTAGTAALFKDNLTAMSKIGRGSIELEHEKGGDIIIEGDTADIRKLGLMQLGGSEDSIGLGINVTSLANATNAIDQIDAALDRIGTIRGDIGAVQNRLNSTITNLETNSTNLSAAQSRLRDTDFSQETANLTRSQILQQVGISMLSQANQGPQQILSLLQ